MNDADSRAVAKAMTGVIGGTPDLHTDFAARLVAELKRLGFKVSPCGLPSGEYAMPKAAMPGSER